MIFVPEQSDQSLSCSLEEDIHVVLSMYPLSMQRILIRPSRCPSLSLTLLGLYFICINHIKYILIRFNLFLPCEVQLYKKTWKTMIRQKLKKRGLSYERVYFIKQVLLLHDMACIPKVVHY